MARDANLGANSVASGASVSLTTSAAAAAGTRVFLELAWWSSTTPSPTVTAAGGLTWTKHTQANNGTGDRFAIWSADAPAGLPISTTLTIGSLGSADGGALIGGVSETGAATFDTSNTATGSGTGWTSGAATNAVAGATFVGGSGSETAASSSSTAVNGTEIHDRWQTGAAQGFATGDLVAAGTGSQAITGTFSASSTANTGALVIFSPSGGAAAIPPSLVMAPRTGR